MSTKRNKKYCINYDEPIDITIGKKVYKNVSEKTEKKEQVKSILSKLDINTEIPTDTETDQIEITNTKSKSLVKVNDKKKSQEIELMQSLDEIGCKFNMIILNMFKHIEEYYDKYYIEFSDLKNLLNQMSKQNDRCLIELFIKNIYANDDYRTNILDQNEDYFLNFTLNSNIITKMKELWKNLDNDSKKFIKKSLLCLVKLSNKYILL